MARHHWWNSLPGQYYDAETGKNYNYFRDYDPTTGRYVESDPIGLNGGVNTYNYVGNNPLKFFDLLGLSSLVFNPSNGTLTVISGSGAYLATFQAANNAQTGSRGAWPVGTYDYEYYVPHAAEGPNGPYGSNGNFVFDVPGCSGCGVHSGRAYSTDLAGRKGVRFATNGCICTTDDATALMKALDENDDPLTTLTVTNLPYPTVPPPFAPGLNGAPIPIP